MKNKPELSRDFIFTLYGQNPRLGMMPTLWDKMSAEKRTEHLEKAEDVIKRLVP